MAPRKNLPADKATKLQTALIGAVSEKDIRSIVKKLIELAAAGDLRATELLLNRLYGKPDSGPKSPLVAVQTVVSNSCPELDVGAIVNRIRSSRDAGDDQ